MLTRDIPEKKLKAGDVGTVVMVYKDGEAFEVEFMTLDGDTFALATLMADRMCARLEGSRRAAREVARGATWQGKDTYAVVIAESRARSACGFPTCPAAPQWARAASSDPRSFPPRRVRRSRRRDEARPASPATALKSPIIHEKARPRRHGKAAVDKQIAR